MTDMQLPSGYSDDRALPEAVERSISPFGIVRVLLGLLLLTAAGLKGFALATSPTVESGLLTSRWFLMVTVEAELLLGLWLLSGIFVQALWWSAIACFSIFTSFTLYQAMSGAESCGCFGQIEVNPWYTFGIDAAAVLALLAFPPTAAAGAPSGRPSTSRISLVVLIALAVGVPGGIVMATYSPPTLDADGVLQADDGTVVLDLDSWVGHQFPLQKYTDAGESLGVGEWAVVLYLHSCPTCQRALPGYERVAQQWSEAGDSRRLALVELPPYAADHGHERGTASEFVLQTRLNDQYDWHVRVPASLDLVEGEVLATPSDWLEESSAARSSPVPEAYAQAKDSRALDDASAGCVACDAAGGAVNTETSF